MRTVWTWMAIGGAILGAYLAQTFFNLTSTQIAIAYGIVALMALSFQVNSLKEEKPRFKKKRLNDLFYSEPIDVKHKAPQNLTADGKERWGAEDHDFECF